MVTKIKFYQQEIIYYPQCKRTLLEILTSELSDVGQGLFTFKGFRITFRCSFDYILEQLSYDLNYYDQENIKLL